ncbi:MAG: DUF72 domain-containing protein [Planctomycetes bacterium]|nr:DUF72 domain-containing protein [Planctomycetota bacterium]
MDAAAEKVRIGASGWSYQDWIGPFYPAGTRSADFLARYAAHFPVVEVDSTFYAIPRHATFENWRAVTPESFRFALKVPRPVTHGSGDERPDLEKVLRNEDGSLERFLEAAALLGKKLGPLVFQFPYFRVKEMQAADFFERLDQALARVPAEVRCAVEIRNKSWIKPEFLELLKRRRAGCVLIDHPYMLPAAQQLQLGMVTADFAYIRLLGDRHAIEKQTRTWDKVVVDRKDSLAEWAEAIQKIAALDSVREVYAFSNNHYAGHAPATCRELARLVGGSS